MPVPARTIIAGPIRTISGRSRGAQDRYGHDSEESTIAGRRSPTIVPAATSWSHCAEASGFSGGGAWGRRLSEIAWTRRRQRRAANHVGRRRQVGGPGWRQRWGGQSRRGGNKRRKSRVQTSLGSAAGATERDKAIKDNNGPARRRASAISGLARAKYPYITNFSFQQERPCEQHLVMTALHLIGRYCGFSILVKRRLYQASFIDKGS